MVPNSSKCFVVYFIIRLNGDIIYTVLFEKSGRQILGKNGAHSCFSAVPCHSGLPRVCYNSFCAVQVHRNKICHILLLIYSVGKSLKHFQARFSMPNEGRSNSHQWHSFDFGAIHVTMVSTEASVVFLQLG